MSAVAQIAKFQGYEVSGCDLQSDTPYISKVLKMGIPVAAGHDQNHLKSIDLLAVTPAAFYQSPDHPELTLAKDRGILVKWQQFLGDYLHHDKFVICIAGTHGKSTTTAMAGLLLEQAGLDPAVEVGATVKTWQGNVRLGTGKYFVSEADEFHNNFLHYHPDIIILNNIELDHPEFFPTFDRLLETYADFIKNLKPGGVLIYNADSPGVRQLISLHKSDFTGHNLYPYRLTEFPHNLTLQIPGQHNKSNALGIIKLAEILNINPEIVHHSLHTFSGLERRLELLGEKAGIKVYDDYANHPTSYRANLEALKQQFPDSRILAVIEPHTFSRLRALLPNLHDAFKLANQVVVSKIFSSREVDPGDFTGADIVTAIGAKALYIPEFPGIESYINTHKSSFDLILVMGSGNSYKLSRQILAAI